MVKVKINRVPKSWDIVEHVDDPDSFIYGSDWEGIFRGANKIVLNGSCAFLGDLMALPLYHTAIRKIAPDAEIFYITDDFQPGGKQGDKGPTDIYDAGYVHLHDERLKFALLNEIPDMLYVDGKIYLHDDEDEEEDMYLVYTREDAEYAELYNQLRDLFYKFVEYGRDYPQERTFIRSKENVGWRIDMPSLDPDNPGETTAELMKKNVRPHEKIDWHKFYQALDRLNLSEEAHLLEEGKVDEVCEMHCDDHILDEFMFEEFKHQSL